MTITYTIPVEELRKHNSREILEIVIPKELHIWENTKQTFVKEENSNGKS